jgi:osmotically-inducible protein OsmY
MTTAPERVGAIPMKRFRQFCAVSSAAIVVAGFCGCAAYRKCGFSGCAGDAKITAEVSALFNQYPALEPPNLLNVQTLDRVVYLTGQVNTDTERDLAKAVALQVVGVRQVINSINVSYQGR